MSLRDILKKLKNEAGTVADAIIPGNQSSWHQAPQPGRPAPAQTVQQINQATGFTAPPPTQLHAPTIKPIQVAPPPSAGQVISSLNNANPLMAPIKLAEGLVKPIVTQPLEHFFAPDPNKVRARDVVRELPGAVNKERDFLANQAVAMARAVPQAGVRMATQAMGMKEYNPSKGIEQLVLGKEPVANIQGYGQQAGQMVGIQNMNPLAAALVGGAMTAMDATPLGGGRKQIAEELAKIADETQVAKHLLGHKIQASPETITRVANSKDPEQIQRLINGKPHIQDDIQHLENQKAAVRSAQDEAAKKSLQARQAADAVALNRPERQALVDARELANAELDKHTAPLNTLDSQIAQLKAQQNLTTKVLDQIGDRTTVSKQFVSDLAKRPDVKQVERDTIQKALDMQEGGKIDVAQLKDDVRRNLVGLNRVESGQWKDYGRDSEYIQGNGASNPNSHVYEGPIEKSPGQGHYRNDKYFAHTRSDEVASDGHPDDFVQPAGDKGWEVYVDGKLHSTGHDADEARRALQDATMDQAKYADWMAKNKPEPMDRPAHIDSGPAKGWTFRDEGGYTNGFFNTKEEVEKHLDEIGRKVAAKPAPSTRRILEMQSDLMQQGRVNKLDPNAPERSAFSTMSDVFSHVHGGGKLSEARQMLADSKHNPEAVLADLKDHADRIPHRIADALDDIEIYKRRLANLQEEAKNGDPVHPTDLQYIQGKIDSLQKEISELQAQQKTAKRLSNYLKRYPPKPAEVDAAATEKFNQLKSYRNTWHERVAREEIMAAAKEGKGSIQFPTGETASIIEQYINPQEMRDGLPEGLHPGQITEDPMSGEDMLILDHPDGDNEYYVLRDWDNHFTYDDFKSEEVQYIIDERFTNDPEYYKDEIAHLWSEEDANAFEKDPQQWINDNYDKAEQIAEREFENQYGYNAHEAARAYEDNIGETAHAAGDTIYTGGETNYESMAQDATLDNFDPKSDLSSDQYRVYEFYEKDLPKFLKKNYPQMERVVDDNGASWWEIPLTKEMGDSPVRAYGHIQINVATQVAKLMTSVAAGVQVKKNDKTGAAMIGFDPKRAVIVLGILNGRALGKFAWDNAPKLIKNEKGAVTIGKKEATEPDWWTKAVEDHQRNNAKILMNDTRLTAEKAPQKGVNIRPENTSPPEAVSEEFKSGSKWNGIKGFPIRVQNQFKDWYNGRRAAAVSGLRVRQEFRSLDKQGLEAVHAFQRGDRSGKLADLHAYFEGKFKQLTDAGIDMGHRTDYITQLWENSPEEVTRALSPRLTPTGSLGKERVFNTYEEGIKAGLTPRFKTAGEIAQWYEGYTNKILNDRRFLDTLIKEGNVVPAHEAPVGWKTVSPDYFPITKTETPEGIHTGVYKAPAPLVEALDRTLGTHQTGLVTRFIRGGKQLVLGAGVPGTGLNYHGSVNLASRVAMTKPHQLVEDFWNMTYVHSATRYLNSKSADLEELVKAGLNVNYDGLGNFAGGKRKITGPLSLHSALFEDPGFSKAYPAMQLRWALAERDAIMKGGLLGRKVSRDEANRIAAHAANDIFSGTNAGELARDPHLQNALSNLFLAPQWAGTNINIGRKMIQSLAHPLDPKYRAYRRLAVGLGTMYAVSNLVNKALSGHYMWENAPGQQLSLDTGGSSEDGKERYLSLFGTAADFVRLPADIASGVKDGDSDVVFRTIRNRLSTAMGTAITLLTGTDYLGNNIYKDKNGNEKTGTEKLISMGTALTSLGAPAQLTAGVKYADGQIDAEQAINAAFEGPFKYKKSIDPETKTYVTLSADYRKQLSNSDMQAVWDYMHKGAKDNSGEKIETKYNLKSATGKYAMFIEHPELLAAETAFQRQLSATTGQQIDPFYRLSPRQQQEQLMVKMANKLFPGELSKDKKALNADLPAGYQAAQSQYYDQLSAKLGPTPAVSGVPAYPEPSASVSAKLDAGNTKDPEVKAWFAQLDTYNNAKRSQLGLPSLDDVSPYPKKGSGKGGRRSSGVKFKKVSTKDKAIKLKKSKGIKLAKAPKVKGLKVAVKAPKTVKLAKLKGVSIKSSLKA